MRIEWAAASVCPRAQARMIFELHSFVCACICGAEGGGEAPLLFWLLIAFISRPTHPALGRWSLAPVV
jgi:hypothetical protein